LYFDRLPKKGRGAEQGQHERFIFRRAGPEARVYDAFGGVA